MDSRDQVWRSWRNGKGGRERRQDRQKRYAFTLSEGLRSTHQAARKKETQHKSRGGERQPRLKATETQKDAPCRCLGSPKQLSLAYFKTFIRASPVTTPGLTSLGKPMAVLELRAKREERERRGRESRRREEATRLNEQIHEDYQQLYLRHPHCARPSGGS